MRQKFEKKVSGLGGLIWLCKHCRRAVKNSLHLDVLIYAPFFKSHFLPTTMIMPYLLRRIEHSVYVCLQSKCSKGLFICLAQFQRCITDHCNDAIVTKTMLPATMIYIDKKKRKFSSYISKFRMEHLQALPHI